MKNPFDLHGKVVVVTGAAGGLGTVIVRTLAVMGADIAALDLKEPPGTSEIETEFGVRCLPVACDITREADTVAAISLITSKLGGIDALVNNAGLYGGLNMRTFTEIDEAEWDKVFEVNAKGTWLMTKAAVPALRARGGGGSIVNIASCSILQGTPLLGHYVASKGAVWAMSRTMANELGGDNIRVNSVSPGFTLTEASFKVSGTKQDLDANKGRNLNTRSIQRDMLAEDVPGAVGFLVSDASAFITGQNINVDGGSVHY